MGSLSESADVKFVQLAQKYTTLQNAEDSCRAQPGRQC